MHLIGLGVVFNISPAFLYLYKVVFCGFICNTATSIIYLFVNQIDGCVADKVADGVADIYLQHNKHEYIRTN